MPVSRLTRAGLVLSTAAVALIAVTSGSAQTGAVAQTTSSKLVELRDMSEFRARFNADADFMRLVLLVSPT